MCSGVDEEIMFVQFPISYLCQGRRWTCSAIINCTIVELLQTWSDHACLSTGGKFHNVKICYSGKFYNFKCWEKSLLRLTFPQKDLWKNSSSIIPYYHLALVERSLFLNSCTVSLNQGGFTFQLLSLCLRPVIFTGIDSFIFVWTCMCIFICLYVLIALLTLCCWPKASGAISQTILSYLADPCWLLCLYFVFVFCICVFTYSMPCLCIVVTTNSKPVKLVPVAELSLARPSGCPELAGGRGRPFLTGDMYCIYILYLYLYLHFQL